MPHRESANMQLIDHGVVERRARSTIIAPRERGIDHTRLRHACRTVMLVERQILFRMTDAIAELRVTPPDLPLDMLRVRLDQQLVRVEAMPTLGLIWAMHTIAVKEARPC